MFHLDFEAELGVKVSFLSMESHSLESLVDFNEADCS